MSLLHLFPKRRKENDKEFQLWPVLRFFGVCKCKIFAQFSKHVGLDWESNDVTEKMKKKPIWHLKYAHKYYKKKLLRVSSKTKWSILSSRPHKFDRFQCLTDKRADIWRAETLQVKPRNFATLEISSAHNTEICVSLHVLCHWTFLLSLYETRHSMFTMFTCWQSGAIDDENGAQWDKEQEPGTLHSAPLWGKQ